MFDYMIINAVPSYVQAPVGLELIRANPARFLEAVALRNFQKSYLLIQSTQQDIIDILTQQKEKLEQMGLAIIPIDSPYSFVFSNSSAAIKAIDGEKPLPKAVGNGQLVYTVEDILDCNDKTLFLSCDGKDASKISVGKEISLAEIASHCALEDELKAVYFGYPMGKMLCEKDIQLKTQITSDYAVIYTDKHCILNQLKIHIKQFLDQCCGQCVFGYEGIGQIYTILSDISNKKGKVSDLELLRELCTVIKTQSLCDIGVVAANLTLQTIDDFKDEIEQHITKKKCKAEFCSKYITYHILPERCKGCSQCTVLCANEAISGKNKFVHMIDQEECEQCGMCFNSCVNCAIIKAGTVKPKDLTKPVPCK